MSRNGIGCLMMFLFAIQAAYGEEPRSISDAKSTIAIYSQDWGRTSSGKRQLIFCIWDDGKVVWSHDREVGGAPYYEGNIKPELVQAKLDQLDSVGLLDSKAARTGGMVVIDGQFTTILVKHKGKELELSTSHEPIDLMAMFGRDGEEVSKNEKFSRLVDRINDGIAPFQLAWLQLNVTAARLTPATGEKTEGDVEMRAGKLSWKSN